jgi:hypothetical protein
VLSEDAPGAHRDWREKIGQGQKGDMKRGLDPGCLGTGSACVWYLQFAEKMPFGSTPVSLFDYISVIEFLRRERPTAGCPANPRRPMHTLISLALAAAVALPFAICLAMPGLASVPCFPSRKTNFV